MKAGTGQWHGARAPIRRAAGILGLAACLAWAATSPGSAQEKSEVAGAPPAAEGKAEKPRPPGNPALPRLSDGNLRVIPPPPIPPAIPGDAPPASEEPAPMPAGTPSVEAPAPATAETPPAAKAPAKAKPKPKPKAKTAAKAKSTSPQSKPAVETRPTGAPRKPNPFAALFVKTPPAEADADKKSAASKATPAKASNTATKSRSGAYAVITAPTGAYVYRSATTSMISMKLSPGDVVQILETTGDRHRIRTRGGAEGYIKLDAQRKATSAEARRFQR